MSKILELNYSTSSSNFITEVKESIVKGEHVHDL